MVPTYFLDFKLEKDRTYEHIIPNGWNSMIIVYKGSLDLQNGAQNLKTFDGAVLERTDNSETIKIRALEDGASFILLAGQQINEPIARKSNYVMNTPEECE